MGAEQWGNGNMVKEEIKVIVVTCNVLQSRAELLCFHVR